MLEGDLAGVFASLSEPSGIKASITFMRLQETTRMGIVKGEISALKSTLDNVVQALKRLSLKIDDQGLADGTY